jgi:hypothetical protein
MVAPWARRTVASTHRSVEFAECESSLFGHCRRSTSGRGTQQCATARPRWGPDPRPVDDMIGPADDSSGTDASGSVIVPGRIRTLRAE